MSFKPMPCHRALGLPLVPGNKSQETRDFSRTQMTTAPSISASSTERPSLARIMSATMLQAGAARQSSRIGSRPTSLPPPSLLWGLISATHEHTASHPWACFQHPTFIPSSSTPRTISPTIMPPWQGPATIILPMKWPKVACLLTAHSAAATHKVIASMPLRPTTTVSRRQHIQLPTACRLPPIHLQATQRFRTPSVFNPTAQTSMKVLRQTLSPTTVMSSMRRAPRRLHRLLPKRQANIPRKYPSRHRPRLRKRKRWQIPPRLLKAPRPRTLRLSCHLPHLPRITCRELMSPPPRHHRTGCQTLRLLCKATRQWSIKGWVPLMAKKRPLPPSRQSLPPRRLIRALRLQAARRLESDPPEMTPMAKCLRISVESPLLRLVWRPT